ncbi:hypothetical protein BDZ91DRAFT_745031, partial [Kalaharituber pfeilii]
AELKLRQEVTPLSEHDPTNTIYSYCYLASGASFYKDNFKLRPEQFMVGRNGQGKFDYAIVCHSTGRILGVVQAKKDNFMKGFCTGVCTDGIILEPVVVVYNDENMEAKVKKVLAHIVWLLGEAQKPVEASQIQVGEESREIKRVRR